MKTDLLQLPMLTIAEAAVVTGLTLDQVNGWLEPIDDLVTMRECLFCRVMAGTAKLPPASRVPIAHTASTEALPGGARIYTVAWEDGEDSATCGWVNEVQPGLTREVSLLPVEYWFGKIAERLLLLRHAAGGPN